MGDAAGYLDGSIGGGGTVGVGAGDASEDRIGQ